MKKVILYVILLMIVSQIRVNKIDISDLEPVQAVWIRKDGEMYVITTDTEDTGVGRSVKDALQSMKEKCEKIIYLDTAEYLVVSENCKEAVGDISEFLKDKVKVCVWNGEGKLENVAEYIKSHRIGIRLKDYISDVKLPIIPALSAE